MNLSELFGKVASETDGGTVRMVTPEEYRKFHYPDYPNAKTLPALVRHFKKTDPEYFAKVRDDVQKNGFSTPILVQYKDQRGNDLKKPYVREGHHRAAVAHDLGIHLPVGDYDNEADFQRSRAGNAEWFKNNERGPQGVSWEASLRPRKAAGDPGVYRGLSLVLPPDIHKMVHDPAQPAAARAHMLLSEIRKQKEGHQGEEATGETGGIGSFWTPHRRKAEEYATQSGFGAYKEHELEHNCGDEFYGHGGCPTTRVVVHAQTPPVEHHWTEIFRPGERYDPEISWRLPVRPGTPMSVKAISWREGNDHHSSEEKYSAEGMAAERAPYEGYDFSAGVSKRASADLPPEHDGGEIPSDWLKLHGHQVRVHTDGHSNVELVPTYDLTRYATQETDPAHAKKVAEHVLTVGHMKPLILQYHPKTSEAYLGEGNHRLYVARKLGMSHVPVRVTRAAYGLAGEGSRTPQEHPAVTAGAHVPSDIRPSEIGLNVMPPRPRTAKVTSGPGEAPPMGEDHYDEDDGEYRQLWDEWHPKLQPTIHRHLAMDLSKGHPAHDEKLPMAARAHALLEDAGQYHPSGRLGWHWTDDASYKHLTGPRISAGQTPVTIHAQTPPRSHIEDNEWTLREDRAVRDWDTDPEREVPLKRNAPVNVTGISWNSGGKMVHHQFGGPIQKRAGANGNLPEGLTFHHEQVMDGKLHHMIARHPDAPHQEMWGNHVGRITWWSSDGEVSNLHVEPQYQRRGVATELWNRAKAVQPDLKHSEEQTEEGAAWARTTAAYAPPGTMGTDNEGHRVQMTTMDGWAHDDGSHGHEDNTTIGDHPVYTQTHTWLPEGRYWGPNSAQNDQRLFEGDHLRPEVRQDILSRINSFMRPRYKNWPKWTRVYFAGSEAARWAPFNGDFDCLLGADFETFRKENPEYAAQPDDAIAKMITDGMWHTINVDGYWFTLADGRKVGPFDRTFFMNPNAWDIRNLKPYAAYNVSDDTWAVHPLEVPKDWDATHLPESYWTYAESVLNEIKAIGQLPPEERHRMAANLWEELHTHRSDAFNGDGKGLYDLSNVIEKYLDQHPDKPWDQLVQWKNEAPSGPSPWVPTTARRTILSMLFDAKAKEPEGADSSGLMVAIVPPKSLGKKLLVEGGEPLESLHVTLCYLGSVSEYSAKQVDELETLVHAWAGTQKPLTARVGGAGTFYNPSEHVLMAHVDIPHGGGFRHSLSELLEAHGYNVRNDHGWTPHITLKYHKQPVRFLPKVEPESWDVSEVVVCVGGKWTPLPLG